MTSSAMVFLQTTITWCVLAKQIAQNAPRDINPKPIPGISHYLPPWVATREFDSSIFSENNVCVGIDNSNQCIFGGLWWTTNWRIWRNTKKPEKIQVSYFFTMFLWDSFCSIQKGDRPYYIILRRTDVRLTVPVVLPQKISEKLVQFGAFSECPDPLQGCPHQETIEKKATLGKILPWKNNFRRKKKFWPTFFFALQKKGTLNFWGGPDAADPPWIRPR